MSKYIIIGLILLGLLPVSCQELPGAIITGAESTDVYLPLIRGKKIAVVANQTSLVGTAHLVDTLLGSGVTIVRILVPEHGFRGSAGAGVKVEDETDPRSGLPIVSLYGDHQKPRPADLEGIDLVLFDLQDVGVRCYTYLSTLHYVMEACAENGLPLCVLDRPDPLGRMIDGPVLEPSFRSFVGMHPIPLVHGMTLGELAGMINGEGWLKEGIRCDLTVVPCKNYTHDREYSLPVRPSPNLPDMHAILLYPSLVLFEGTVISVGRGTDMPFEVYGHPLLKSDFSFIPQKNQANSQPLHLGQICYGEDLREYRSPDNWQTLNLDWLLEAYRTYPDQENFFSSFFDKLAGTTQLRQQIGEGKTEGEIRESWREGLELFREKRKIYLLYP
ncbi:MAG: exo-beta-N-acetylmuramidase NamZ family protein [Bacteroidota bacterium]